MKSKIKLGNLLKTISLSTNKIGIFETNSGSPITIDDSATGLQVELKVTNAGYTVNIDSNGVPEKFNSGPFKPVFTIIN